MNREDTVNKLPKICAECGHCARPQGSMRTYLCTFSQKSAPIDLVTGLPTIPDKHCRDERMECGDCGPEGKNWKPMSLPSPIKWTDDGRSGSTGRAKNWI